MEAHSLAAPRGGLTIPRSRKLLGALTDERLVDQLRRGNEAAFEVIYDRHHAALLSYCRHMLGSRDEAEDALQQAFISAHTDIVSSDKPIRLKAWLYTIARNRCLSILRARREQPSEDLEVVSTTGLGEEVQQRADLKDLLADMHELPEDQRAALILSELGDLSHQEIAEVIGCEVGKVKSLVFQARSGLIERRQGRETSCEEIREQLATLRGGSLRRGPLRRHVKACPGCTEFRDEVRRQRQMMAAVLPVVPTLALKESALAAVGIGAGSAGGGALLGGGSGAIVAAKAGVAKVAVIAVATTGAVGGAVAVQEKNGVGSDKASQPPAGQIESTPATGAAGAGTLEDASRGASTEASAPATTAPGEEKSRQAREDDGRGRSEEARALAPGQAADRQRGFAPEPGSSNGERARDFAGERGKGRKRGLDKQAAREERTARGGANPNRKAERGRKKPRREKPAGSQRAESRPAPGSHGNPPAGPTVPVLPPQAQGSPRAHPEPPVLPITGSRQVRRGPREDPSL